MYALLSACKTLGCNRILPSIYSLHHINVVRKYDTTFQCLIHDNYHLVVRYYTIKAVGNPAIEPKKEPKCGMEKVPSSINSHLNHMGDASSSVCDYQGEIIKVLRGRDLSCEILLFSIGHT